MKKLLLVWLVILGVCFPVWADQTLPSKITHVTLFSDQALIQRTAQASVPAGLNTLQMEVGAFYVDADSVTAKISGAGEIFGVQYKEVPVSQTPQADIRDLEKALEALKKTQTSLTDQKKVLDHKKDFLNGFIDFSHTQISKEVQTRWPNLADMDKTLGFLGDSFQKIFTRQQALDTELKQVADEIAALQRKIDGLQGQKMKSRRLIEIVFNAARAQKIEVAAQYLVQRAAWQPLYRVMVPPALDRADLGMFAKISQKTGENWHQVALSVSNVLPLKGVGVPQLYTWQLDIPRPKPVMIERRARMEMDELATKKLAGAPPPPVTEAPKEEAAFASARRQRSPLAFTYEMPLAVNIDASPQETLLPLFSKQLKGEFVHLAVPKQRPTTYLVGNFKADKELLGGWLNVYFGGRYVGKTRLEEKKAGDAFRLNLGADREVLVTRKKSSDKIKESFFGKFERTTVVRELAYVITAENLKDRPVKLQVVDNLPVSRTDKIVVEDLALTPKPAQTNYQNREGVTLWVLDLKPGAKAEINISFKVSYPKDAVPEGL